MKLTTDNKTEDFGHKKFKFKIDEKHAFKAIWALINLYKYKIQTPVQEVISNARDAHREVGKPDHTFDIKVTDTEFIVRDYGSGIDPVKAENIFCSIGESTKTGDNGQTGGFGIGAKSPLAYTKQFEMISYVDGTKYHYFIAKNGEMLDMNLISTESTKAKNGTKVIIPIKQNTGYYRNESDKKSFIKAVDRCCYFWENRPNFNHEIEPLKLFKIKGKSNYAFHNANIVDGNLVVVDGIPYNANTNQWNYSGSRVAFFNTGDLRIHETRERLADNPDDSAYNMDKVNEAMDYIKNHMDVKLNDYIDKDSIFKSLKVLSDFAIPFNYRHGNYRFKNRFIELEGYGKKFTVYTSKSGGRYPYNYRYRKEDQSRLNYNVEVFYDNTGDSVQKVSRRVKGYLTQFVENKENKTVYVTTNKQIANIFGAKDLSTLEVPKVNRTGVKKQNEQITITELYCYGQSRIYKKLDDIVSKYIYLGFKEDISETMRSFLDRKGYRVCKLSKDNIEKVTGHGKFTEYHNFVENYKLTQDEIDGIYYSSIRRYNFNVNFTELLDSKIKRYKEIADQYKRCDSYGVPVSLYTKEVEATIEKISAENAEIIHIKDYISGEYPMLGHGKDVNTEYINAIYSYRKNLHGEK